MDTTITMTLELPRDMATELEHVRRQQSCTRDELLCEALRFYLDFSDSLHRMQSTELLAE